ncbi:MAG: hypothetical protein FGM24_08345 [Candidatus Kapabacteria bacterium]|nr:hypothetical protein [Candidatus Kapabacteria bacterium]
MLYRIQYLLGAMLGIFSLVYILFGIVGWLSSDASFQDVLTCFVLASIHVVAAGGLFIASIRSYRRECARLETVVRVLQERHAGRVTVADVAALADVSHDDAREYLVRNANTRDVVITEGRNGNDAFLFGQQYRNN